MRECAELRRLLGQVLGILGEAVRDRDDLTEANDGLRATLKDLALRLAERQAEARRLAERAAAERSQLFTAIRHGISLDVPWRGEALDLIHHLFAEGDQP
jgi:predicted nuclease with TOPRIM domain